MNATRRTSNFASQYNASGKQNSIDCLLQCCKFAGPKCLWEANFIGLLGQLLIISNFTTANRQNCACFYNFRFYFFRNHEYTQAVKPFHHLQRNFPYYELNWIRIEMINENCNTKIVCSEILIWRHFTVISFVFYRFPWELRTAERSTSQVRNSFQPKFWLYVHTETLQQCFS